MTQFHWMTRWRASGLATWALALAAAAMMTALSATTAATTAQAQSSRIGFYGSHGYEMAPRESRSAGRSSRRANRSYAKADDDSTPKRQSRRARIAKHDDDGDSGQAPKRRSGGGGVSWVASGGCLPGSLKSVIAETSSYGRVVVSSTHRSGGRNRAVGGASRSYHLSCQAADFRVHGANVSAVASFLRNHGSVGGFHHYGGGLFHIDTGPKRSW